MHESVLIGRNITPGRCGFQLTKRPNRVRKRILCFIRGRHGYGVNFDMLQRKKN